MKWNKVKFLLVFVLIFVFTNCDKINEKGKVVFSGHPDVINCPAYIVVTLNKDCVGILYFSEDSISIEKPVGNYNYRAELITKSGSAAYWDGSFKIKKDSCTTIDFGF
ncbi:MAG: hypothetical protein ACQERX_05740 [Bacillota bacterium]